jgi:hypothetical protein
MMNFPNRTGDSQMAEHGDGRKAFLEVAKGAEKTIGFISKSSDFLASRFENSLWDDCFSWLNACLRDGACWPLLLNIPRGIPNKACCLRVAVIRLRSVL